MSPEPEVGWRSKEDIWEDISGEVRRTKAGGEGEVEREDGGVGRIEVNDSSAACTFVGEDVFVVVVAAVEEEEVEIEAGGGFLGEDVVEEGDFWGVVGEEG